MSWASLLKKSGSWRFIALVLAPGLAEACERVGRGCVRGCNEGVRAEIMRGCVDNMCYRVMWCKSSPIY